VLKAVDEVDDGGWYEHTTSRRFTGEEVGAELGGTTRPRETPLYFTTIVGGWEAKSTNLDFTRWQCHRDRSR
jgi:hypothetical protein